LTQEDVIVSDMSAVGTCFPGDSQVRLESGDTVQLKDLRVGDRVLAMDGANLPVYDDVILMLDRREDDVLLYYTLRTETGRSITLSADHMVFTSDVHGAPMTAKHASDVTTGEYMHVWDANSNTFTPRKIVTIQIETKQGAFAPLTMQGTVVVDGHVASSYAVRTDHVTAHRYMAPWRLAYKIQKSVFGIEPYIPEQHGIHWSVQYGVRLFCAIRGSDKCSGLMNMDL
jgi:hypothetical protein